MSQQIHPSMMSFYGVVEDRHDPMKIGRVRVRIHGIHNADKTQIATPDLPWAQVLLPTTSAGLSGFGTQHGLVEGSTVFGFFRDSSQQNPIITGTVAGIPQEGWKVDVTGKEVARSVETGFNDPRRVGKGISAYTDTIDGVATTENPNRSWGLEVGLDESPQIPESVTIDYFGLGSTITEPSTKETPYYPLEFGVSDVDADARGDNTYEYGYRDRNFSILFGGNRLIQTKAEPVYPFNKTLKTESGHLLELDDTVGAERIAVEHRSGTFHSIEPDGSQMTQVVNDQYTVICKDNEVHIGGKVNVVIMGDSNIKTYGDVKLKGYGNGEIDVTGTMDIKSGENMTIQSAKVLFLKGQVVQQG
jgi:hypothetical protein